MSVGSSRIFDQWSAAKTIPFSIAIFVGNSRDFPDIVAKPIVTESWILAIKAIPKASRDEIVGCEAGELKVKLRAVPEDGKANKALIRFLSKQAGIPRSAIELQSGATSRHKRLKIIGISQSCFFETLGIVVS